MDLNNYLKIIIEGVIEVENLKSYFIRLQKVNERDNFITKIEFYSRLTNVTDDLKTKCKERFYKRKNELYLILDLKKAKNQDTKEIEKEINFITPDKFPLNIIHITNGQFKGFLSYSKIEYVQSIILEILKNEINLFNTTKQPQQTENKGLDENKKELHNNIFKGNTFSLWFKYYENKNIDVTCKTDLRVIYELMKKDNYFQDTIELKHYINWLNSEFFDGAIMELKKQYLDSSQNQQRLKDYEHYKINLKLTFK